MERKAMNTRILAAVLLGLIAAGAAWHHLRKPLGPPGLRVNLEAMALGNCSRTKALDHVPTEVIDKW
jgi:hypothetical protein